MSRTAFEFILCADDYALSPAVSAGILEAASLGRISAASAMTNRPDWPEAAIRWQQTCPNAALGLHLNLTLGAPLTAMPLFAPRNILPDINSVMRMGRDGTLPLAEVAAEIAAQIASFCRHFGQRPEFIDGHQHVHGLPPVANCLFPILIQRQWQGQLWVRNSADQLIRIIQRRSAIKKALALAYLTRDFSSSAATAGFICNDGFSGFSAFNARADYEQEFRKNLIAPGPRHLIMCHPGHIDNELRAADSVVTTREQELGFLLSQRFGQLVQESTAQMVRQWRMGKLK